MHDFKKLRILEKGSAERSVKFTKHVRFSQTSKSSVRSSPNRKNHDGVRWLQKITWNIDKSPKIFNCILPMLENNAHILHGCVTLAKYGYGIDATAENLIQFAMKWGNLEGFKLFYKHIPHERLAQNGRYTLLCAIEGKNMEILEAIKPHVDFDYAFGLSRQCNPWTAAPLEFTIVRHAGLKIFKYVYSQTKLTLDYVRILYNLATADLEQPIDSGVCDTSKDMKNSSHEIIHFLESRHLRKRKAKRNSVPTRKSARIMAKNLQKLHV